MVFSKTYEVRGHHVRIVLAPRQAERLQRTCFRGVDIAKAGNFSRWGSFEKILNDTDFAAPLIDVCLKVKVHDREAVDIRTTLTLSSVVGWVSTMPLDVARQRRLLLLEFQPNRLHTALRIADPVVGAPRTNLVTVAAKVCKITHPSPFGREIIIQTLYPGKDIGSLMESTADLTLAKEVVFFDWDANGA